MRHLNSLRNIIALLFIIGCNGRTEVKVGEAKVTEIKDSTSRLVPASPPATNLKVSAYLIYNDGSISSFDVLNNKSIALWNTIIGGGDAIKPSTKVKLVLDGYVEDLLVTIKNGQRPLIKRTASNFVGQIYSIIKNTGCEEVSIKVFGRDKLLYSGVIPFHCGE
jgi:hypothetical protein